MVFREPQDRGVTWVSQGEVLDGLHESRGVVGLEEQRTEWPGVGEAQREGGMAMGTQAELTVERG